MVRPHPARSHRFWFSRIHQIALTHSLTHSLAHPLTHALTHSLTHSLTLSLTHSLTHSRARSHARRRPALHSSSNGWSSFCFVRAVVWGRQSIDLDVFVTWFGAGLPGFQVLRWCSVQEPCGWCLCVVVESGSHGRKRCCGDRLKRGNVAKHHG